MRVLLVEDEQRLAENVAAALREGPGFAVDVASDGQDGLAMGETGVYDLVILDLMLPGMSGAQLLRQLRASRQNVPVLVLTAVSGKTSIVEMLNTGADDYLGKPFDLGELIARSKALIRRGKGIGNPIIQIGPLTIDTLERTVTQHGRLIDLSPTEYRILEYLGHHPKSVVSKGRLLEHLYDYTWESHSNVIEAHISNLRRKLNACKGAPRVETLRGRGYRLARAPEEPA